MRYTSEVTCQVAGVGAQWLRTNIHRGVIVPDDGAMPGKGHLRDLSRSGVFQCTFIAKAREAGVPLKRAALLWQTLAAQSDLSNVALYVRNLPDNSDCEFKMARADQPRPADVPGEAARLDVGEIQRDVWRKLDNVDAERICADPTLYPWRLPFVASHNPGAPWTIVLVNEEGAPDANAVARLCDAVEAESHILIAGASKEAMMRVVAVLDRMLNAPALHAAETVH